MLAVLLIVCTTGFGQKAFISNSVSAGDISIVNTTNNAILSPVSFAGAGNGHTGICSSPDGTKMYFVKSNGHQLISFNAITNAQIGSNFELGTSTFPEGICISPDGNKVYITSLNDSRVKKVTISTMVLEYSLPNIATLAQHICITPNGDKLFVSRSTGSNNVVVLNATDLSVMGTTTAGNSPYGIAMSPVEHKV